MDIESVLQALHRACPGQEFAAQAIPIDETVVAVPAACLHPAVSALYEVIQDCHLSTITGQDTGSALEVLYHFWHRRGLTLRVQLPYADPRVVTITGVIPGAVFYEQEIAEMLGITFEGHPDPRRLFLPDDWDGAYPLRKGG